MCVCVCVNRYGFMFRSVCGICRLPLAASSHTCSRACIHVHMYICYTHYTHTKYPFSLFISCLLCVCARVRVYTYTYVIYTHIRMHFRTHVFCVYVYNTFL